MVLSKQFYPFHWVQKWQRGNIYHNINPSKTLPMTSAWTRYGGILCFYSWRKMTMKYQEFGFLCCVASCRWLVLTYHVCQMPCLVTDVAWWRHQMETFSALLAICAGNSPVTGEFPGEYPTQRPVTQSFDVFFDLSLNKWFSKQWWGWWFEMPLHSLWCHCNGFSEWIMFIKNCVCIRDKAGQGLFWVWTQPIL